MSKLVSIILVTYNSSEYIEKCLNSIKQSSYKQIEIIVFDNASTDNTVSIIKKLAHLSTKVIENKKNIGYADANNQAVKIAKGEFVFILNPDTVVTPHFLEPLVKKMTDSENTAVCQPLVYLFDKKTVNLTGKETHYLGFDWIKDFETKRKLETEQIYSFSGSGVLIRKRIFEMLGGYDEQYFMYYEDSDLSLRMHLFNYDIFFVPASIIYHDYKFLPKESYQSLHRKLFYIERNRVITLLKNYSSKTLALIFPIFLFMEFGLLFLALIQGWIVPKINSYKSIITLFPQIMKKRVEIQRGRKVSDTAIAQTLQSSITFSFGKFSNPVLLKILNQILSVYFKGIRHFI